MLWASFSIVYTDKCTFLLVNKLKKTFESGAEQKHAF